MPNNPSILILTSGSPASNPRMVKEAPPTRQKGGYDVHVLYGFIASWADKLDGAILHEAKWTASRVGGHPVDDRLPWIISRFLHKAAELFQMRGIFKFTYSRLSLPLLIRGFRQKPDAIIAHNLGALSSAHVLAKLKRVPLFFDAEDFHRGESDNPKKNLAALRVENKFLPHCEGISAASQSIGKAYHDLFPKSKIIVVNNCFSIVDQKELNPIKETELRIAWFSQTVGPDRGLLEFIEALQNLQHETRIDITLIGNCTASFAKRISGIISECPIVDLHLMPPMSEERIMSVLRRSHLGLALERSHPCNRDICMTNKVFSYLLNGCQILFSNTAAQSEFVRKYDFSGKIVDLEKTESIQRSILWFLDHFALLDKMRFKNWSLAKNELHYEKDSAEWFNFIEMTLRQ